MSLMRRDEGISHLPVTFRPSFPEAFAALSAYRVVVSVMSK
jgi:hypothetical protein